MKKILILSLVLFTLTNCKNKETEELETTTESVTETVEENTNPSIKECYFYDANGSKIELEMTKNEDDEISGTLIYALKEKDRNEGTINGKISGDKLIATYTFQSEGTESTREVAFLIKDNQLIEGYGDITTEGTSAKFKDLNTLDFSSKMILSKTDCQ